MAEAATGKVEALTGCAKHGNVKAKALTKKTETATRKAKQKNSLIYANTVRLKGKGERGKVSNTSFTLYPLTFSQTTREVHTAYPNRIVMYAGFYVNYPNQRNIKNYPSCRDIAMQRL
jgi:hypothetical protein